MRCAVGGPQAHPPPCRPDCGCSGRRGRQPPCSWRAPVCPAEARAGRPTRGNIHQPRQVPSAPLCSPLFDKVCISAAARRRRLPRCHAGQLRQRRSGAVGAPTVCTTVCVAWHWAALAQAVGPPASAASRPPIATMTAVLALQAATATLPADSRAAGASTGTSYGMPVHKSSCSTSAAVTCRHRRGSRHAAPEQHSHGTSALSCS